MKLISLAYRDNHWKVNHLSFTDSNLIVGVNSTGKTRVMHTIDLLVKILTQQRDLNWGATWQLGFVDDNEDKYAYEFTTVPTGSGSVRFERLEVNGVVKVQRRRDGSVAIWNNATQSQDSVFPPEDKLVIHSNRDTKRYPYLERIAQWAERSFGFKFGNISPNMQLNLQEYDLLTSVDQIPELYRSLSPASKQKVLDQMNQIGFPVELITATESRYGIMLKVSEHGLAKPLAHFKLSQGMFRSLALVIFIEYLLLQKNPAMLIIDDLCEGLDYQRATKLGKLVFDQCASSQIQLIATSNDSFLMDVIDLDKWNLLRRSGNAVEAINIRNSPELFERFKFTGMSNFDFLSSSFLAQQAQ